MFSLIYNLVGNSCSDVECSLKANRLNEGIPEFMLYECRIGCSGLVCFLGCSSGMNETGLTAGSLDRTAGSLAWTAAILLSVVLFWPSVLH